ncbi:radical SAM domain protein [Candidatus Moduliflexus flocculans]|uniref:Radical SAM domain protein n=1 Tax=Candidatus Moduliflexus flocculans TaxID=1499966 RepID=A0A081BM21_9BACT|nr:radical SAM domain protein [Candidatus Moduliflexus flocculans]
MTSKASREFQVFAKPIGAACNLDCRYCYYLKTEQFYTENEPARMPLNLLEEYIVQQIEAFPGEEIRFSWHGGEPTLAGLDYFRAIAAIQRKHQPRNWRILNGMQTNGTLLDDEWCRFLAQEGFFVGVSLDGTPELHDAYRTTKQQQPTHAQALRGYHLLRKHGVACDLLCVVNALNVKQPLEIYRFFKEINASYLTFLPLVERDEDGNVSPLSVPSAAFGEFLCAIFDEWQANDIGKIKVQIFEEAARTAFGQEHSLCIFRPTCGDIPVIERNGDVYSCDHYVNQEHLLGNIKTTPLVDMLDSPAQMAFGKKKATLPRYCQRCEVKAMCYGECPKNRFLQTPDGEPGLNYLCAGYRRFFTHCQPFVQAVAAEWRRQTQPQPPIARKPVDGNALKAGRNDPCPCGSGLKYKKCCLGKK